LREIHRVLKPGDRAMLFELQQDLDVDELARIIRANLAEASLLRRWAAA
jgi:hypothetical protein